MKNNIFQHQENIVQENIFQHQENIHGKLLTCV
jgi:hypothetical protein